MINSLLWTPLAFGIVGLFLPKRVTGWWATLGAVVTLGSRSAGRSASTPAPPACRTRVDVDWIPGLGVDYSLGIDGLNLFLILLTAVLWIGGIAFAAFREQERPQLFFLLMLVARDGDAGLLPGPGPAALRPLLRPDAGPVLLPLRRLGQRPRGRPDARRRRR